MEKVITITGFISNLATIVGIAALVYTYRDTILGKKALNLDVMVYCINRFTALVSELNNPKISEDALKSYIELTNEELFYISKKYLADEVALEWIDGMIEFIPLYNCKNQLINGNAKLDKHKWEQATKGYPRIIHFSTENDFTPGDMQSNEKRRALAKLLYKRMKQYEY
jgi:hypothetical protein